MFRLSIVFLITAVLAFSATFRLYLTDGTYQLAREYKVESDRVRYFSTEREQWEEIPLNLVDLKKTESEMKRREEESKQTAAELADQEKIERAVRKEGEAVPMDPGVYIAAGDQVKPIPAAETAVVNDKKRSVLKALSPIPLVSGKATLEVTGAHSPNVFTDPLQEFYIRLSAEERFGIIKLADHKGNRVVERLTIIPVSKQMMEEQDEVQTFRRQLGDMLYKIWPMKPLEPGEYAVVEYTPASDDNTVRLQTWDFSYNPKK